MFGRRLCLRRALEVMLMNEQNTPPADQAARQDAIDINDFVYAATGARVRRLTLPDGEHWFPAADVATDLGYANTRQALIWHVPDDCKLSLRELAQGVYGVDALRKLAGHGLQKTMKMVNLQGLIRLTNGCTKRETEPFKRWITDVVVTVQREGSYSLEKAEVQPTAPDSPTAYAMPKQVADAIVGLEEHNLRLDEEWRAARDADLRFQEDTRAFQARTLGLLERMADALEERVGRVRSDVSASGAPREGVPLPATGESLLSLWRRRHLAITDDVWPVAALLAGALAAHGEARYRVETIAARTGLPQQQAVAALRLLLRHHCFHQRGVDQDGAQIYVLPGA